MSSYNHFGCLWCEGPFNGGNCPGCSSVGSRNDFVYDPNPYSYNETPDFFNQPPQHQYETYSYELCGDSPHYGFDCQTRTPLVYEQDPCSNQDYSNDQSPYHSTSLPEQFCCCEICGVTPPAYSPSLPFLAAMEPTDTLLMGDEVISTILTWEINEFIKSSVDDLVLIPRESEVTLDSNYECDMPTPLPTTDVREDKFDISLPLG
ncbi:hypothetical protein Tco_0939358 [Tanacetum coccineum]|uniref:Uncharacterized protein n=1 Tax=Tanacetum coccineum TaxID=301880 RepID=A0ABQ5DMF8_9ASTR